MREAYQSSGLYESHLSSLLADRPAVIAGNLAARVCPDSTYGCLLLSPRRP